MNVKKGRSYEKRFEIAAPADAVWKAITEGEELTRWFCQQASSEPDLGGEQHIDWGGGARATQAIVVWELNSHLRTEAVSPKREGSSDFEPYATDWYLEHEGGITRIRMVVSGFGEGADWDHEYDGTYHGWDLFHKTLKHYLEHHRGEPAANVVLYAVLAVPADKAWSRLMGAEGLINKGCLDDLTIGAPFSFETRDGDIFSGIVRNYVPGKTFSAMVDSLNKSILNLEIATIPGQGHFLYLCLNTWGMPKDDVDALGTRLRRIVYGLFPQTTETPYSACAVEKQS
jgi:uncharacterized protein YndB with AHSA1/START domain